ncbi:MAG TPA: FemAB family XrtA/PEP-CTERM system-associated protein [Gemmataceae bacterium]|jgi:FemAB-related protein (PEP-CTERM system-associated)|nr:FemAB family XrtA/PEP-CTERM system-associated protein [Gemmataceae bacterium]
MPLIIPHADTRKQAVEVRLQERHALEGRVRHWEEYFARQAPIRPLSLDPGWLTVLAKALKHQVYVVEAVEGDRTRGVLLLAYVSSLLFGRYLVSLPYLNYGGVLADDDSIAQQLLDRAVVLADQLKVRYLEVRHQHLIAHPAFGTCRTDKVNMRLDLPASSEELWTGLDGKVRNQIRKAQKSDLTVAWGTGDLLDDFYRVFSHNMRDLGTPVYGKRLFRLILDQFPGRSEICVVRAGSTPTAAGMLLHGFGVSEVPSASSLRRYNPTCANMLLYWHMLERSVQRGQDFFDFGRSSRDSATFSFKKQWGAQPLDSIWQYYLRTGDPQDSKRDSPRFRFLVRLWQRLPVRLTRMLGPLIVRGIPA